MVHVPDSGDAPSTFANESSLLPVPFDKVLREYDELIECLEAPLRKVRENRAAVVALQNDTRNLNAALRHAQQRAQELGLLQPPPDPAARLWIVPAEQEPPQTENPHPQTRAAADSAAPSPGEPAPSSDSDDSTVPEEVVVRGARMKEILNVIGSRPGTAWGSGDVADLLGIGRSDRSGRRALRANLHALTERGALERVAVEGDSRAYYKPRMNWRFI